MTVFFSPHRLNGSAFEQTRAFDGNAIWYVIDKAVFSLCPANSSTISNLQRNVNYVSVNNAPI